MTLTQPPFTLPVHPFALHPAMAMCPAGSFQAGPVGVVAAVYQYAWARAMAMTLVVAQQQSPHRRSRFEPSAN